MSLVVTEATGFLGRGIVPTFVKSGTPILLIDQNVESAKLAFPEIEVSNYENLNVAAKGFDVLVHLAIQNNNKKGDTQKLRKDNLGLLKDVVHAAKIAGIKTFVYITSIHVVEGNKNTPYSQSKKEAETTCQKLRG